MYLSLKMKIGVFTRLLAIFAACCMLVAPFSALAENQPAAQNSNDSGFSFQDVEVVFDADPVPPSYEYHSDTLDIEISENNVDGVVYYIAEIWLTDPSQLRSAFSSEKFNGATETVKDIAIRNGALLAINGDFATFNNGGIIIRNGELFRDNRSSRQLLVIDANGDFHAYVDPPENAEEVAVEYLAQGVWQTLVFGPVLMADGNVVPLPEEFFINTRGAREPRTVIAQVEKLHYLFLVADGRIDGYSKGLTLLETQDLMLQYGVQTAFNLDGGGSTTIWFDGAVLNRPANGAARRVPDILFISK